MEDSETFDALPIRIDPVSKAIQTTSSSKALNEELAKLNALHKSILALETPVPPPPMPVNQKRTAGITKLRETGNDAFRKSKHAEAIKYYTLGLQMALGRPLWEPQGLVREEVSGIYANRAQAHMALQNWVEGAVDAEASVEMKRVGNAKAWWRRGKCLMEMGRWEEAKEWVGKGLELEGSETDLTGLLKEIEKHVDVKKA